MISESKNRKTVSLIHIQDLLFENQDLKYKNFQQKLIPTINTDTVIGVRIPVLRKIAKYLYNSCDMSAFLHNTNHKFYEEKNLHAFLIECINDYDSCIEEINRFLPYKEFW